ncbi:MULTISPECIES: hypothetical protein [unclassified Methylibium]|uniref:hypothetical protein n=1 Tax=unclassified Methylibium TaxID=2633235 RepID=UPI0003F3F5A5|nr:MULTISPECIES: hypothetical protein [unclassified Methylibium]EWS54894.1 hypothetical protein X551_02289 [Methylibium sp. T29]EWS61752.1 hypothetical protein Y694_00538 [Methylibium sp. T29-B]
MASTAHSMDAGRSIRTTATVLVLFASGVANALTEADCDGMHRLVDHTFRDLAQLTGDVLERSPGQVAIHRVSGSTLPFEQCKILRFEGDSALRVLECDIAGQSGIDRIDGLQSDVTLAITTKTMQSIADDYAACFFKRWTRSEDSTTRRGRVRSSWTWALTLDSQPAYRGIASLVVEQSKVGQPIGIPAITFNFYRVEHSAKN